MDIAEEGGGVSNLENSKDCSNKRKNEAHICRDELKRMKNM
jgi:hypothetical protein